MRSPFDNTAVHVKCRSPRVKEGPIGGLLSEPEAATRSKIESQKSKSQRLSLTDFFKPTARPMTKSKG